MTLALVIGLSAAVFSLLIVAHTSNEILQQAIAQSRQTAEIIRRSTRYAMLQNHREQVDRIIEAVSRTRGFEKIRIFDREGRIITSTLPSELGTRVDTSAEACYGCHAAGKPLTQVPGTDRHRIYTSPAGHRILGTIDVIRNETACSTADCHAHPPAVTVLGVLDIAYSLDDFDAGRRDDILTVAGISTMLALVIFMGILVLTMTHLVLFAPIAIRAKAWLIIASFTGALADEAAGWLVRFVHPAFAWLKLAGFAVLQGSLAIMIVIVAWAVWTTPPNGYRGGG